MKRAAAAVFIAFVALLWLQLHGLAQQPQFVPGAESAGALRNSAFSIATSTSDDVRRLSPMVQGWVADGTLAPRLVYDDNDVLGRRHEGFIQYYKGIRVYGADVMRQTERGVTVSLFGTVYSNIDLDVSARLSAREAIEKLNAASSSTRLTSSDPGLTILPLLNGRFALAYSAPMRDGMTYFIDANDGELLRKIVNVHDQSAVGSGRGVLGDMKKLSTTQSGGAFRTRDSLRPGAIITLDARNNPSSFARLEQGGRWSDSDMAADADNNWTDPAVVDAHAHMGWVYDYFAKTHGYQGLDGRNGPMIGVVVSRTAIADNAAFVQPPAGPDGGGGMFFGETSAGTPITTLDVVGHELTHGVNHFALMRRTGRTLGPSFVLESGPASIVIAGNSYPCTQTVLGGQPFYCLGGRYVVASDNAGALNEGIADVFGTAVEFAYQPAGNGSQRADYLIGEDLPSIGGRTGPLRSLDNPASVAITTGVAYPDHYARRVTFAVIINSRGQLEISPLGVVGSNGFILPNPDDGAVHMDSTIISHAFYLAIEGGQNRTSGRTVQGVGSTNRSQIERIFFRAIRDLIPSSVTFPQMAAALRQAAVDLYGSSGLPTTAVDQALTAVGL